MAGGFWVKREYDEFDWTDVEYANFSFVLPAILGQRLPQIPLGPRQPGAIIEQFCTDGVFSKVPLVLNDGDELGQWEREVRAP